MGEGGRGERWEVVSELTAMAEEQGDSALDWGFLVDEMDVDAPEAVDLDLGLVVGELVDFGFGFPPVVALEPVLGQAFDVGQGGAMVPAGFVKLVGEGGVGELLGELLKLLIGNGDGEGLDWGHGWSIDGFDARGQRGGPPLLSFHGLVRHV